MVDYLFVLSLLIIGAVAQYDVLKQWKYHWALKIIELAVSWTYIEIVRPMKDGKLTPSQSEQARRAAVKKAKSIAAEKGVNLDQVLGEQLLEMFVELAVSKAKK